ncbi:hypothetical protein [Lysobacter olei]
MSGISVGGAFGGASRANPAVSFDLAGALAVSRNLGLLESSLGKFEQRALGTAQRRLGPQARRDIQGEYNIKAARVTKDLRVSAPRLGDLRITGYFRGIGMRNFGARQTGKGVTGSIFKGKRSLINGAFYAPLLGGGDNRHVVERFGPKRKMTAGNYIGQRRQPLVVEYGPTVAQMLRKEGRPQRLADYAIGLLGAEMARQVDSHLRHQAARNGSSA